MPAETATARTLLPDPLRERAAAGAGAVDACAESPRPLLETLATDGLLTLGAPGASGTWTDQVGVVAALAEECMATAFSAWGHRMALEYVAPRGGELVDQLSRLVKPGSSAMAAGFKAHVGLGPLPVTARREGRGPRGGDALVLDGRIPWASNLYDDAIIVLAAAVEGDGPRVVALDASTPGVSVKPARDLLALESTASGMLVLDGARVPLEAASDETFAAFARRVRRRFLTLQSAFCVGLARASMQAARPSLTGLGEEFAVEHAELELTLGDVASRLGVLADDEAAPILAAVRLRLDAAVLAREAVRVEAAVTGGRGYVASSPTARRLREAAFLPVQSPTEGQLRWELRRAA